ncbi:MAG: methyltransferase, partial [Deltaproteobacteria bacterium]|nr:methyltransferase [Deltaproteobacteria bacterium]
MDPTRTVLDRLHAAAKRDRLRYFSLLPRLVGGFARRKTFFEIITPASMKDCYIPISREQGQFLYVSVRALQAKNIIEFGTSFAISTIYLAAALRDNGQGVVIGTEIEPSKCSRARKNLKDAG